MRRVLIAVIVVIAVFAAAQLVPYGHRHENPPVVVEPPWSSPEVRALAVRACFACHSNQTTWPWYANVAPVSWLVQHDVDEGREELNFSEWNRPQKEARKAAAVVVEGEMPPVYYVWLHREAALTPAERDTLVAGLRAMFGAAPAPDGHD